ncbi:hypothetical protein V2H45_23120 [Tumidithrix elongata RA019]|uniref:Uncharacterized protein n=1 Tax=Tumidithrix elongata BACA0141 TaxID=2716417 RepID=A0AAW9PYV5_9CYAN|nr:hypothetical protein [Tumidithrix elongata RA019]
MKFNSSCGLTGSSGIMKLCKVSQVAMLALVATTVTIVSSDRFGIENARAETTDTMLPSTVIVAQNSQAWNTGVRLLRVFDNSGRFLGIGIQLDVLNKPVTKYANVVYQLSVGREGRWVDLYSSTGARLLPKTAGSLTPPVEIVSIDEIASQLGTSTNALPDLDLRAVTLIKYDTRELREQVIAIEAIQPFRAIAQASMNEVSNRQILEVRPQTSTQTPSRSTRPLPSAMPAVPSRPVPAVNPPSSSPNPNVNSGDAELGIPNDIYPNRKNWQK